MSLTTVLWIVYGVGFVVSLRAAARYYHDLPDKPGDIKTYRKPGKSLLAACVPSFLWPPILVFAFLWWLAETAPTKLSLITKKFLGVK